MIHGKYIGQGNDLTEIKQLRARIFNTRLQPDAADGKADSFYDLREDLDSMALNAIIDVDGKPVGVGRLVLDLIEDRFYVDNIGILEEERGKKYGDFVLRMLADKANQCAASELWAEVPAQAKGFFEKRFFEEAGSAGELILMHAGIAKFQSCCAARQSQEAGGDEAQQALSACGAGCGVTDCASCNGCGSGASGK